MGKRRDENPDGGRYHVYGRGNDRCVIFRDQADRDLYLRLLTEVVERAGWHVLAWCQMDNHVHLVIETARGNLAWGMQWLHSRYARAFNERHGRSGHLFQGAYGSTVIEDDGHMCMTLRYVALNPVEAGLCQHPGDWPHASCAAALRGEHSPLLSLTRMLEYFEWLGGDPLARFREMIAPR